MTGILNHDNFCIKMVYSLKVRGEKKPLSLWEVLGLVMHEAIKVKIKDAKVAPCIWSY